MKPDCAETPTNSDAILQREFEKNNTNNLSIERIETNTNSSVFAAEWDIEWTDYEKCAGHDPQTPATSYAVRAHLVQRGYGRSLIKLIFEWVAKIWNVTLRRAVFGGAPSPDSRLRWFSTATGRTPGSIPNCDREASNHTSPHKDETDITLKIGTSSAYC